MGTYNTPALLANMWATLTSRCSSTLTMSSGGDQQVGRRRGAHALHEMSMRSLSGTMGTAPTPGRSTTMRRRPYPAASGSGGDVRTQHSLHTPMSVVISSDIH